MLKADDAVLYMDILTEFACVLFCCIVASIISGFSREKT
jgi:hypothetical protein